MCLRRRPEAPYPPHVCACVLTAGGGDVKSRVYTRPSNAGRGLDGPGGLEGLLVGPIYLDVVHPLHVSRPA